MTAPDTQFWKDARTVLPAYCNHRQRDHKIDAMLELKPMLEKCYNTGTEESSWGVIIRRDQLRTIVLGLEALEAPLL